MLKKSLHISVIFLLLLATTGVSISRHYCNGVLISSSLFGHAKSCCNSSCNSCHEETSFNKLNTDFVYSDSNIIHPNIYSFIQLIYCSLPSYIVNDTSLKPFNILSLKAPPPGLLAIVPEYLEIFRC
jgi:hypothetical protein